MPPGFTVSWLSTEARPLTDRATVALWPAASVPEDGETVSLPIRLEDSVIDQVTGPPEAVTVRLPPSSGLSTIAVGVTLIVPGAGAGGGGGGGAAVAVLVGVPVAVLVAVALPVGGAGEPGSVLGPEDGAVADGDGPAGGGGEPPAVGAGEPSAVGEGDRWTRLLAGTVRCAGAPGLLGRAPAAAPDVAPVLPPGTAP
jgi:hypothetical protein